MRARVSLMAALAAAACLGTSVHAAPGARIADAAGDAITQQAGHDIVSVSITSTRAGTGPNAPVKDFTITLRTAGPVQLGLGTVFAVEATVEGCGTFEVRAYRGLIGAIWGPDMVGDSGSFGCVADPHLVWGPLYSVNPTMTLDHDTISWTVRGSGVPSFIKPGTAFKELHAYVAPAEPGGGNSAAHQNRAVSFDSTSSVTWKYGS